MTKVFMIIEKHKAFLVMMLPCRFIAVREMSGRNKIPQGQGIVRELYRVSGKF